MRYHRSVLDLDTIIYNDEENSIHIVDLFQTKRGRTMKTVNIKFVIFCPINCTICQGYSSYHGFTQNLITLIFAYAFRYKELHFWTFQSLIFFIHKACPSLFVAFKDQIIFISPDNWLINRTYPCTIFFVTVQSKPVWLHNMT